VNGLLGEQGLFAFQQDGRSAILHGGGAFRLLDPQLRAADSIMGRNSSIVVKACSNPPAAWPVDRGLT
jgi:hypothetical protein